MFYARVEPQMCTLQPQQNDDWLHFSVIKKKKSIPHTAATLLTLSYSYSLENKVCANIFGISHMKIVVGMPVGQVQ